MRRLVESYKVWLKESADLLLLRHDGLGKTDTVQTCITEGCNCLHRRSEARNHSRRFCANVQICVRDTFQIRRHSGKIVSAQIKRGRPTRLRQPGGSVAANVGLAGSSWGDLDREDLCGARGRVASIAFFVSGSPMFRLVQGARWQRCWVGKCMLLSFLRFGGGI